MHMIPAAFQLYLNSATRFSADKVEAMLTQAKSYFRYCEENALDAQSGFTARIFRERLRAQSKEPGVLQDAEQMLLLWAEFHSRHIPPDMEARLGFSRPGIVGPTGTLSFVPGRPDSEPLNQISLFADTGESAACREEWRASGNAMAQAMRGRGFSWKTQTAYLGSLRRFKKFLPPGTRLQDICADDADRHLDYMTHHQKLSPSSIRISTFGLKFWFQNILHQPPAAAFLKPMPATPRKPPVVFSPSEVKEFLAHAEGRMHLLFTLLYGCGMRLEEG